MLCAKERRDERKLRKNTGYPELLGPSGAAQWVLLDIASHTPSLRQILRGWDESIKARPLQRPVQIKRARDHCTVHKIPNNSLSCEMKD